MLCYVHRTSSREIFTISSQMKEFNENVKISNMFLLGKLQACPDFKTNILLFSMRVDCTQPSIFSYFYSIAERTGRIERELDASPKRETASLLRALKNTEAVNSSSLQMGEGASLQSSNTPQSDFNPQIKVTLL